MEIKLTGFTVTLADSITWGESEKIKMAMMGGVNVQGGKAEGFNVNPKGMLEAKYVTIETCVRKITAEGGTEVKWSRDWMNALSKPDGDTLMAAIDSLTDGEKK